MKIKVVGIGNRLRRDDAAGLEAVGLWEHKYPKCNRPLETVYYESEGFNLLETLDGTDHAILVDAVNLAGEAGKILSLELEELSDSGCKSVSAHGWGVAEVLKLSQSINSGKLNSGIRLIGIAGEDFIPGVGLSVRVSEAVQRAADVIENEVQQFLQFKD